MADIVEEAKVIKELVNLYIKKNFYSPNPLYPAMQYAMEGGKYIRSLLMIKAAQLCNVTQEQILPSACAIEMMHNYSLIHDDLPSIDNDDLRRGKPTLHKKYDEATAILAGDALQSIAFEMISKPHPLINPTYQVKLIHEFAIAAGVHGMAGGQMLDIHNHDIRHDKEKILLMQQGKTGALFSFSLKAAAIIKNDDAKYEVLSKIGYHIGTIFQLTDDLIDATVSEEVAGKKTGKDKIGNKASILHCEGIHYTQQLVQFYIDETMDLCKSFCEDTTFFEDLLIYLQHRKK